jgi:RND family efflux transporter MFP subunit
MTISINRSIRTPALLAAISLLCAAGCRKQGGDAAGTTAAVMTVGPENIAIVKAEEIQSGPTLSGSLSAETQATVRSEVSGAVLETYADAGTTVSKGQRLARIDDSGIRDQFISARSAVTTADNSVQIAKREADRADVLTKAGAIAEREQDQAHNALTAAQAQAADARARLANAQKQLDKTTIRAPFAGVVSERTANAGDFVSPGTATFTIINPSTMRLEASVPAEALSSIRIGAPVEFTVNGYPTRRFEGHISSINPVADPATRQVRVIVTIPNEGGTLVAGLFAEGKVAAESRTSPVVPITAVDESGIRPSVMRLAGGKVSKVEVTLGIRDATTEMVEVSSGVVPGDTVLLGAARGIAPGTPVKVAEPLDVKK